MSLQSKLQGIIDAEAKLKTLDLNELRMLITTRYEDHRYLRFALYRKLGLTELAEKELKND
ncbi:MAG TPA: hypothetical protein VFM18_11840 [Methanosarcina sp.]|nr:hypothetical protein [Methanosarcina sp.]